MTPKLHITLNRYGVKQRELRIVHLNPLHIVAVVPMGKHTEILTVPGVVYTIAETDAEVLAKVAEIISQGAPA